MDIWFSLMCQEISLINFNKKKLWKKRIPKTISSKSNLKSILILHLLHINKNLRAMLGRILFFFCWSLSLSLHLSLFLSLFLFQRTVFNAMRELWKFIAWQRQWHWAVLFFLSSSFSSAADYFSNEHLVQRIGNKEMDKRSKTFGWIFSIGKGWSEQRSGDRRLCL